MIFVHYDSQLGDILGFYSPELQYLGGMPQPNIAINDDQHDDYFKCRQQFKVIDGQWTYVEPTPPTFEEIKTQQLAMIDAEYEPNFKELQLAWAAANLADNTDAAASVRAEYTTLMSEYQSRREGITNAV